MIATRFQQMLVCIANLLDARWQAYPWRIIDSAAAQGKQDFLVLQLRASYG
jgi:hypothetical protein